MISLLLPNKNEPEIQMTISKIEALQLPMRMEIIVCNDPEGKGKGWAVRQGLQFAKGDLICFLDGDGDIHPSMLKRLLPYIEDYDIVVGIKPISGLLSRRILTYFSRLYIALLFGIKVDSQTGIKLFRRKAIADFYSNHWLFDLEILCDAKKAGYTMIEVPVEANINRRMKWISIWKTLCESVTLWLETR